MLRVLIWCNVVSCSRVSGVMEVAMVVCIWCGGGRCVCVLRASGVMGVGVFVCRAYLV